MNLQLESASAAIRAGQEDDANRSLRAAEREIEHLEKLFQQ